MCVEQRTLTKIMPNILGGLYRKSLQQVLFSRTKTCAFSCGSAQTDLVVSSVARPSSFGAVQQLFGALRLGWCYALQRLKQPGCAHAGANTHRHHAPLLFGAAHAMNEGGGT